MLLLNKSIKAISTKQIIHKTYSKNTQISHFIFMFQIQLTRIMTKVEYRQSSKLTNRPQHQSRTTGKTKQNIIEITKDNFH